MSKKRCRRGHRNRSAVSVTRITVDVGLTIKLIHIAARAQMFIFTKLHGHKTITKPSKSSSESESSVHCCHAAVKTKRERMKSKNSTKTEQINRISVNGDNWHAQKLFVNVILDSVIVCSVIVLCAQGMDLSRQHGFSGPPVGRFRPVRGAIDEGGFGRYKGEWVRMIICCILKSSTSFIFHFY